MLLTRTTPRKVPPRHIRPPPQHRRAVAHDVLQVGRHPFAHHRGNHAIRFAQHVKASGHLKRRPQHVLPLLRRQPRADPVQPLPRLVQSFTAPLGSVRLRIHRAFAVKDKRGVRLNQRIQYLRHHALPRICLRKTPRRVGDMEADVRIVSIETLRQRNHVSSVVVRHRGGGLILRRLDDADRWDAALLRKNRIKSSAFDHLTESRRTGRRPNLVTVRGIPVFLSKRKDRFRGHVHLLRKRTRLIARFPIGIDKGHVQLTDIQHVFRERIKRHDLIAIARGVFLKRRCPNQRAFIERCERVRGPVVKEKGISVPVFHRPGLQGGVLHHPSCLTHVIAFRRRNIRRVHRLTRNMVFGIIRVGRLWSTCPLMHQHRLYRLPKGNTGRVFSSLSFDNRSDFRQIRLNVPGFIKTCNDIKFLSCDFTMKHNDIIYRVVRKRERYILLFENP